MKLEQVINQDPEIHGGTPVFKGTQVSVEALIDHLKAGENLDYFFQGFPSVSREQANHFFRIRLGPNNPITPSDKKESEPSCVLPSGEQIRELRHLNNSQRFK